MFTLCLSILNICVYVYNVLTWCQQERILTQALTLGQEARKAQCMYLCYHKIQCTNYGQ